MSDGTISVSHGDIAAQAKHLADLKNQLEQVLDATRKQVNSLVESGGFKSQSGESFNRVHEEWTASTLKSVQLLEDMSTFLTKAGDAFQKIDEEFTLKG